MIKTFKEILEEEKIVMPRTKMAAKRLQRFSPNRSVDFDVDEDSVELFTNEFPLTCNFVTTKKIMENIIICHREKHFRLQKTRLQLMNEENYHYRNQSFYYSIED